MIHERLKILNCLYILNWVLLPLKLNYKKIYEIDLDKILTFKFDDGSIFTQILNITARVKWII